MRGNKGQRAPSNWTPGFTVLPGILLAATPLDSLHPLLPCENWGVSGETWHGLKRFESAGNQRQKDKKAKHTKTRNRLLRFNNHSRLPTDHSFPLCDRNPAGWGPQS